MKIIAKYKYARSNFEIKATYEAGLVLYGWEVKSIRASNVSLSGAFCNFKGQELFLNNMNIAQYMAVQGDATRPRKLLLKKKQLLKIKSAQETQRLVIIPLKIYFTKNSLIKAEIALAKGLRKHDKRRVLKEREMEKRLQKTLKEYH